MKDKSIPFDELYNKVHLKGNKKKKKKKKKKNYNRIILFIFNKIYWPTEKKIIKILLENQKIIINRV